MDFNVGHIFAKNRTQAKAIYNPWFFFHEFGSKFNLQQNGHRLNTPFMLITMVQVPPPYLIPSPRYLAKHIVQTSISLSWVGIPEFFSVDSISLSASPK